MPDRDFEMLTRRIAAVEATLARSAAPAEHPARPLRSRGRRLSLVVVTALILLLAPVVALAGHNFTDVPNSNPFHGDIAVFKDAGITAGCGGGNFCPKDNVTREQMAAFFNRGLPRVSEASRGVTLNLTDTPQEVMAITVRAGNITGGTAYVKVDVSVTARTPSNTGCPCAAQFTIPLEGTAQTLELAGNLTGANTSFENASFSFVRQIPTGTPVTIAVHGVRFQGTGEIRAGGQMSAITTAFEYP